MNDYNIVLAVFVFLFGIIFGSFYNVVIYRIPMEMSISKGRSMCFNCKHKLSALDLVPLFSYIFLKGRCRYCNTKISIRYFVVELITGISFLVAYLHFGATLELLLMCSLYSMLIITFFIDFDTMCIYDIVLIIFSAINLVIIFMINGLDIKTNLFGAVVGFVIYFVIYFVSKLIYKQEAFGFGDVLLNTSIGLVIGMPLIILSSFMSFFVALFIIGIFSLFGKKFKLKQEIPFGPNMCISAFIVSVYGFKIINLYMNMIN